MRVRHRGHEPLVHPTAYVAPNAVLSGDVRVGRDSRILFGATLTAEGGPIEVGEECVVMEGVVLRGTRRHPLIIENNVLLGPRAYLTGCHVGQDVFVASGAVVFNGAILESGSEVRINGVVHVNSRLEARAIVPIGWVAVGDPAEVLPPSQHDRIWSIQERLDFPGTVFGIRRSESDESITREMTKLYSRSLGAHSADSVLGG